MPTPSHADEKKTKKQIMHVTRIPYMYLRLGITRRQDSDQKIEQMRWFRRLLRRNALRLPPMAWPLSSEKSENTSSVLVQDNVLKINARYVATLAVLAHPIQQWSCPERSIRRQDVSTIVHVAKNGSVMLTKENLPAVKQKMWIGGIFYKNHASEYKH